MHYTGEHRRTRSKLLSHLEEPRSRFFRAFASSQWATTGPGRFASRRGSASGSLIQWWHEESLKSDIIRLEASGNSMKPLRVIRHITICLSILYGVVLTVQPRGAGSLDRDGVSSVAMLVPSGEAAKYWPRWRGPSGQGVVEDTGYPDLWSDQENVLWKMETPGQGNSSPVIWQDRIFLTTAYEGGSRRSILCLRRSDGKLLWETFAPDAKP